MRIDSLSWHYAERGKADGVTENGFSGARQFSIKSPLATRKPSINTRFLRSSEGVFCVSWEGFCVVVLRMSSLLFWG